MAQLRPGLAVLMLLQWSAIADAGLALQYYPDTGSSPNVTYWPQTVLDSDTIVEVNASKVRDTFVIIRSYFGPFRKGATLPFKECSTIEMIPDPADSLRDLIRAPVVDGLLADNTLPVDEVNELARYPVPGKEARYIISISTFPKKKNFSWRFTVQTVGGDMMLLQNNRVYTPAKVMAWSVNKYNKLYRNVWVPHPYVRDESDFIRQLKQEIAYKRNFLRVTQTKDINARLNKLQRYVRPMDNKPDGPLRTRAYSYRAIAASGTVGTAYLRKHAGEPPLSDYPSLIIDQQYQQRDSAALPWLRQNIQRALNKSPSLRWPLRYCNPDANAPVDTIAFLCQGAKTLAALGDDKALPQIRASIAWQLAQGRDWWSNAIPFTLSEERASRPFKSHPVPETDPLIKMTRAIMDDPIFQAYPPMTRERTVLLVKTMRDWIKLYDKQAIPGLLWVWAQDHNPDVLRRYQGIRPQLAQALLKELVNKDLGDNAMAYWNWYLDRVLEAHKKYITGFSG
ncbi:MAG: hypothetical protein BMS9Abin36_2160 [Gammaproteobacteria bacterium]|nr:MAG: hypothetical protein BMS9Abin36_2160 [Gammaproteobacteria bacterium]